MPLYMISHTLGFRFAWHPVLSVRSPSSCAVDLSVKGQHKIDGLRLQDERVKPRGLWSNNLSLSEIAVVEKIKAMYLERGCVEVSYESLHCKKPIHLI